MSNSAFEDEGQAVQPRKPVRAQEPTDARSIGESVQASIANLAYALWHQRGCPAGSCYRDWEEAERQVLEQLGGPKRQS